MADINRQKFAADTKNFLKTQNLSLREAQAQFSGVTAGILSKIGNEHPISAENMLMVCRYFGLNADDYLDIDSPNIRDKFARRRRHNQLKQPVTAVVSVKQPHHTGKFSRRACLPFPKDMGLRELSVFKEKTGDDT